MGHIGLGFINIYVKINEKAMKIIYNSVIPFKGFIMINIFGIFFARKEFKGRIDDTLINHERIHTEQQKELGFIFFYVWYLIEWLIRLLLPGNAYRNISFEKEAYDNKNDKTYINHRKRYNWLKYIF